MRCAICCLPKSGPESAHGRPGPGCGYACFRVLPNAREAGAGLGRSGLAREPFPAATGGRAVETVRLRLGAIDTRMKAASRSGDRRRRAVRGQARSYSRGFRPGDYRAAWSRHGIASSRGVLTNGLTFESILCRRYKHNFSAVDGLSPANEVYPPPGTGRLQP